jgi:hypothetical protein
MFATTYTGTSVVVTNITGQNILARNNLYAPNITGGTVYASNALLPNVINMSEKAIPATFGATVTCDYSLGSIFYLTNMTSMPVTFTTTISNLPSINATGNAYIISLVYASSAAQQYCTTAAVSLSSSGFSSTQSILFSGGASSISVSNGTQVVQQIAFTNYGGSNIKYLSNVSNFIA